MIGYVSKYKCQDINDLAIERRRKIWEKKTIVDQEKQNVEKVRKN